MFPQIIYFLIEIQEAERLYRSIIQSQPTHLDANQNLGVIAVSVDKIEAALPLFKTALEANPKMEQFWLSYIDALIKENQFATAAEVIKQGRNQIDQSTPIERLAPVFGYINFCMYYGRRCTRDGAYTGIPKRLELD